MPNTVAHRRFKDSLYGQFARIGKAVAAPKRFELLDLLCQGPRTVEALAEQTAISIANASQHLKVLRAAHLVEAEKRGLYVHYRVADERVMQFVRSLRVIAESRLAEVEQVTRAYFDDRAKMDAIDVTELHRRLADGRVTLLDVRPVEEYRAGHIPGAVGMPVAELKSRLAELPRSREIVAYCRGPYCVMAIDAVELLRAKGFKARHSDAGILDWRARGWRIESEQEAS
jgi:rhodanese-related sulfurtransferase/DNA-binding transcriptional ArsR family regulator